MTQEEREALIAYAQDRNTVTWDALRNGKVSPDRVKQQLREVGVIIRSIKDDDRPEEIRAKLKAVIKN